MLTNLSSINLVSIFRCSSVPRHPVYVTRVDPSTLPFGLSSHPDPPTLTGIWVFNITLPLSLDNKQQDPWTVLWRTTIYIKPVRLMYLSASHSAYELAPSPSPHSSLTHTHRCIGPFCFELRHFENLYHQFVCHFDQHTTASVFMTYPSVFMEYAWFVCY
jgi:hypothetical protein